MVKMTSADLKGDTAKGARYLSNRQAKLNDKQRKAAPTKRPAAIPVPAPVESEPEFRQHDATLAAACASHPEFDIILKSLEDDRREAKDKEEYYAKRRKDTDDQIRSIMGDIGFNKLYMPDGWVMEELQSHSASKLSAQKLLIMGVDADTIARATEAGASYRYVKVRELSKKEKDALGVAP